MNQTADVKYAYLQTPPAENLGTPHIISKLTDVINLYVAWWLFMLWYSVWNGAGPAAVYFPCCLWLPLLSMSWNHRSSGTLRCLLIASFSEQNNNLELLRDASFSGVNLCIPALICIIYFPIPYPNLIYRDCIHWWTNGEPLMGWVHYQFKSLFCLFDWASWSALQGYIDSINAISLGAGLYCLSYGGHEECSGIHFRVPMFMKNLEK